MTDLHILYFIQSNFCEETRDIKIIFKVFKYRGPEHAQLFIKYYVLQVLGHVHYAVRLLQTFLLYSFYHIS